MPIVSIIKIALIVLGVIITLLVILQQGESGLSEKKNGFLPPQLLSVSFLSDCVWLY
jgi:hypothetical protein